MTANQRYEIEFTTRQGEAAIRQLEQVGGAGEAMARRLRAAMAQSEQSGAGLKSQIAGLKASAESSFASITASIGRVQGAFALLGGGALLGNAIASLKNFREGADALLDVMGGTAQEAGTLKLALDLVGKSSDDYAKTALQVTKNIGKNEDDFRALGLSIRDANGEFVGTGEVMQRALAWLDQYREGTDRNAAAMAIAGKSARELFDMFDMSAEVMDYARSRMEAYGLMTGETADSLLQAKIEMNKFSMEVDLASAALATKLLPALKQLGPVAAEGIGMLSSEIDTLSKIMSGNFASAIDDVAKRWKGLWAQIKGASAALDQWTGLAPKAAGFAGTGSFRAAQDVAQFGAPVARPGDFADAPAGGGLRWGGMPEDGGGGGASRRGGRGGGGGSVPKAPDPWYPLSRPDDLREKELAYLDEMREAHLRAIGDIKAAEELAYQQKLRQIDSMQLTEEESLEATALAMADHQRKLAEYDVAAAEKLIQAQRQASTETGEMWAFAGDLTKRAFSDAFAAITSGAEISLASIAQMIARTVASKGFQMLLDMATGSAGASGGGLGGLLGSIGGWLGIGGGSSAAGSSAGVAGADIGMAYEFHGGGLVGAGGVPRLIPMAAFAGAPRFHGGVTLGEVPAILQRGERVLSRREVAAGVGSGPSAVEVHLHDQRQGGGKMNATATSRQEDGRLIIDAVLTEVDKEIGRGRFDGSMRARYNTPPAVMARG